MKTKEPPKTIRWHGETLELYDPDPCMIYGRAYYTYHREGLSGLWEYCPETGKIVHTRRDD